MSEFRGSRRLMARARDANRVKQINRTYTPPSKDELALKKRLAREAALARSAPFDSSPRLVKQAPKQQS